MDQEHQNINHTPQLITPQSVPGQPFVPSSQQPIQQVPEQPSAPTPTVTHAVSEHAHHPTHTAHSIEGSKKSQSARLSFTGGIITVILSFAIPHLSIITKATDSIPFFTTYGTLALLCIVSVSLFAIPSFKKNKYPNLYGLIGLIFSLIVLYNALSILIVYAFNGNN
jgi:hypothetical protein